MSHRILYVKWIVLKYKRSQSQNIAFMHKPRIIAQKKNQPKNNKKQGINDNANLYIYIFFIINIFLNNCAKLDKAFI